MTTLENLATDIRLTGLTASGTATVESAKSLGQRGLKVILGSKASLDEREVDVGSDPSLQSEGVNRQPFLILIDPSQRQRRTTAIRAFGRRLQRLMRAHKRLTKLSRTAQRYNAATDHYASHI